MTSLLNLAKEMFERATNPAYGVAVNDEHAARLAVAIGPEDVERFTGEVRRLDDPSALTSYGWAWVLEFALGHEVALDLELLQRLADRWDEPALKALTIEAALASVEADSERFSEEWLDGLIELAAPPSVVADDDNAPPVDDDAFGIDYDRGFDPDEWVDTSSAEALLTALLIVGTDPARSAARRLMSRTWPGADGLREFLDARADDGDPLARGPWVALRE